MRKCKCGNQVAGNARFCPKCGHRFTSGAVKFLAWFIVIIFGIGVIGAIIGGSSSSQPIAASSSNGAAPAAASPVKPKAPGDMVAARKVYAKVIDQQLLDMGIESKTYIKGAQAKTLVIEDALAGRVRENAIQKNDSLFDNLRTLGFTHLEYTNGFDGDLNYDVVWTIKP